MATVYQSAANRSNSRRYPERQAQYECLRRTVSNLKQHVVINRVGFDDEGRGVYVLKSANP